MGQTSVLEPGRAYLVADAPELLPDCAAWTQEVKEYAGDEASASRILADFWSEMLLYVAPSENIRGHVQAMARGGEFVTLVWALLFHAGITTRPDAPGVAIV